LGERRQLAEPALGEQIEIADDARERRAQLVRGDRDEVALDARLALELDVLRAQLRLGFRERARARACDLIAVGAQRAELGARGFDFLRTLLEHVAEAHGGVEQLRLRRRRRAAALEPRDEHVDRPLRRGELGLELVDALLEELRARIVGHLGPPNASAVRVWLTRSMPVCSPKL